MKWLILIIAALLIFRMPPLAVVYILVFYFLFSVAKKLAGSRSIERDDALNQTQRQYRHSEYHQFGLSFGQLADLLVLRRELDRLLAAAKIDDEAYRRLVSEIDKLEDRFFSDHGVYPSNQNWRESTESAWDMLNAYADKPVGPAPWVEPAGWENQYEPESGDAEEPVPDSSSAYADADVPDEFAEPLTPTAAESGGWENSPAYLNSTAAPANRGAEKAVESCDIGSAEPVVIPDLQCQTHPPVFDIENYAWQRHEPGPFERALKALSGWHALAAPFLVQNIGWFVGVFLFIAGSIFLVSYSTGYLKSLIAFLSFFLFTLFLLWGGYQIRRRRPDLTASSDVILILSLLLMPLTTATVTRLLMSSETWLFKIVSGLLAVLELGAFYVAVTLVSALMDRSLQRELPKLFLSLTFAQLLLALLNVFPYWPLLALAHTVLFALLGIGVYRFVHDWLHSIFIDRRKIAYFAAGMLVYAALASFIHLTFGAEAEISLPEGYYGPFLMMLCGLLFYVDGQFKQWTESNPSLSRFSFFIYGLSVLALFWAAGHETATMITLIMAIALYALIVWNYLTLTPLYLFLACCFWLYQLSVLRFFSEPAYFLAALPGLSGLYALAGWAMAKRRSAYLALIVFRVFYAFSMALTLWSLGHSRPGVPAMATAFLSGALFYFALRSAPAHLFKVREQMPEIAYPARYGNLLDTSWFYLLPVLAAAAAYYAPLMVGLTSVTQFSFVVLPVVVFWSYKGLFLQARLLAASPVETLERFFNAALLTLAAAAIPIVLMSGPVQILWLGFAGMILLGLSLKLGQRWLFYWMLCSVGAAALLVKRTYFSWPSTGQMEMLSALGVWQLLKYLQYLDNLPAAPLERQQAELNAGMRPAFKLLWRFPVNVKTGVAHDD
ncbi:MAG: hypothetical protein ACU84H_00020 [Gammaproteobacteria bacterium]